MSLPLLLRRSSTLVGSSSRLSSAACTSSIKTSLPLVYPSSRSYATPSDKEFDPRFNKQNKEKDENSNQETPSSNQENSKDEVGKDSKSKPELAPLPKSFSMDVDMPDPSNQTLSITENAADSSSAASRGGRTGAKAKKTGQSAGGVPGGGAAFAVICLGGLGLLGYNYGRDFEDPVAIDRHKDNPLAKTWFGRIRIRLGNVSEEYSRPVWEKLLPDPLPHPYQRPYTLVLDLDELLIHSEWTRSNGWRIAKRPGLDYFLGYLSNFYEIVIYTRQPFFTAEQVVDRLDPDKRKIMYSLFKEACRTKDGKLCKDLESLNRDPSKVIILDTEADGFSLSPENGILVKPWKGEKGDKELLGLLGFLEAIGIYGIPDVRTTIAAYAGTHIPTEHARRQAALKAQELQDLEKKKSSMRLFGGIREPSSGNSNLSWFDQERKRYQDGYAEDEKYWKENGEKFRQQAKEDQERQIKEMKLNAWGFLTGAASAPPQGSEQPKA